MTSSESTLPAIPNVFSPLRRRLFRDLWIASVASNIGTWMQNVGAAWLMTRLGSSPLEVSLIQAASFFPIFLLALPAGALADVVDRRKLLLITQAWMGIAAVILGIMTWNGVTTSGSLLLLTFLLGIGSALGAPAWQAIVPDLVPRDEVHHAVALTSGAYNLARAVGPALGGLVLAAFGAAVNFLLNAASFLGVIVVLYRWSGKSIREGQAVETKGSLENHSKERLLGAMIAGLRYVRHAPALHSVMVRVLAFSLPGAAIWALLPLVVHDRLRGTATDYGILLGCIGVGAVVGSVTQPRLRHLLSLNRMAGLMAGLFGIATLALGLVTNIFVLGTLLAAGGFAWLSLLANLNSAVQISVPGWVRGRALSIYLLIFYAGLSAGSALWGSVADHLGLATSLVIAAVLLILNPLLAFRFRLGGPATSADGILASHHWPDPHQAIAPAPGDGPVLITAEYRIDPENTAKFIEAMRNLERLRRRDGAIHWHLYRDVADPTLFVETFASPTWGEHMRQHGRVTFADQELEAVAFGFLVNGTRPQSRHLVSVT